MGEEIGKKKKREKEKKKRKYRLSRSAIGCTWWD